MAQPIGEPGFPAGLQMITWWERQPRSGNRQTEVAQVLMIQAGAWLFDVAAVVLDEIQVVPHDVGPSRAPAPDHEGDRQCQGLETNEWSNHERDRQFLVSLRGTQGVEG